MFLNLIHDNIKFPFWNFKLWYLYSQTSSPNFQQKQSQTPEEMLEQKKEEIKMMGRSRDAEAELNLPPGFRFHPTDEELVFHYLCRKATHQFLPVPIIAEVDLYKHDPWQLPELALFGQKEWYFFTPRDRKYPNGSRPNRAAGTGYWKATGADKPVALEGGGKPLGIKKALVFYTGKAPRGVKTNWIMHEYRLANVNRSSTKNGGGSLRLDDWVLCRLYHKKNNWEKERQQYQQQQQTHQKSEQTEDGSVGDTMDSFDTVEEVASASHRTAESEIDNDEYAEIAGKTNSRLNDMVVKGGNKQVGESIKDDNSDWYMDLCLDDLQSSFSVSAFGSGLKTGLEMPPYQDFSFSNLMSPDSSSQINLLNF